MHPVEGTHLHSPIIPSAGGLHGQDDLVDGVDLEVVGVVLSLMNYFY